MGLKKLKDPGILDSAVQELVIRYRERARAVGRVYTLCFARFKELIFSPCHYCGAPSEVSMRTTYMNVWEYFRNTIDRVDNSIGYTLNNSVPACLKCNSDKSDLNVIEWLQWIHKIAEHTKDYPGLREAPPLDHRKLTGHLQLTNARKQYALQCAEFSGRMNNGYVDSKN